ncbi:MAG: biotin--[Lachnospiraceae bacterium]|nr:biotin--[acetyl-CoA-carboxylase] ligase [Lachnospiraceae bacterium]
MAVSTKAEILKAIRNSSDHISGQELCEQLGVSRTAVWKVIKQLQAEGYDIEAVTNKGYRLLSYPDVLSGSELMSRMNTKWAGQRVYFRKETESTNEDAKYMAEEGKEHGSLVVADAQTAGRGRRGRSWESPPGQDIYMSLLLRPDFSPEKASMLTLLMAVSVAEVINGLYPDMKVNIKWPNDILVGERKICGILTEMNAEPDYIHNVIIGVGINVNRKDFPPEIEEFATSLRLVHGEMIDRAQIIVGIMDYFEYYYGIFAERLDVSDFVHIYDGYLVNRGREVRVLDPKGEYSGVAEGINDKGELIVKLPDGSSTTVASGEVSVRGIYGYV